LTILFFEDAVAAWNHVKPDKMKCGGKRIYSDLDIEKAHTLRLLYKQPLRQTEELFTSIIQLLKLDLAIPDYTTLSRRAKRIVLSKPPKSSSDSHIIIINGTGLNNYWRKTKIKKCRQPKHKSANWRPNYKSNGGPWRPQGQMCCLKF
jgi:hypothetical protein